MESIGVCAMRFGNQKDRLSMPSNSRAEVDSDIYRSLDFYREPKEYFSLVLDRIEGRLGTPNSIIDVGCSNGAFLFHARQRFGNTVLTGLEPVEELVSLASNHCDADFIRGDLFENNVGRKFNVVTMLGVLGIFSDPGIVISRLLDLKEKDGALFIFSPFNEDPIDVVLDYRVAPDGNWQTGHNLFSKESIEHTVFQLGFHCDWEDFRISQSIAKTDDPMRSWTEHFRGDPNHLVYGTSMFSTMKLLTIY